jgi:transposase
VTSFQTTFAARLETTLPAERPKPVELWAYDESRLGLHTIRRRRITARGTKPVGQLQQRFTNFYLYGAIAPASGDGFFLGMPKFNAEHFQRFLEEFAQARPTTYNVLLLDNSRCHTAQELRIPENIVLLFQEPYAPELNPAERVWEHLKTALAWRCFASLEDLQAEIVRLVTDYDAATLQSLTAYPYIMHAINAVCA